jgi:hypothetical protein
MPLYAFPHQEIVMRTAAEIIASAEEFFDRESLELQINYCKTVLRAAIEDLTDSQPDAKQEASAPTRRAPKRLRLSLTQVNICNQNLAMLTEALRLQKLMTRAAVNRALGADSPFADDPLPGHEGNTYADYWELRLMLRARNARARHYEPRASTRTPQDRAWSPRPERVERARPEALEGQAEQDLNQAIEQWGQAAEQWLAEGDLDKPVPRLSPEAEQKLKQHAKNSPAYAEWVNAINGLIRMAEQRRQNREAGSGGARQKVPA